MSKKLKSQNTKAIAAKERKLLVKEAEIERKKKEIEDSYWEESNKSILKKQQRDEERKKRREKKQEHNIRKVENEIMLEKEVEHIKPKTNIKLTRDTIMTQLETPTKMTDKKLVPLPPLIENLNRQDVEVVEAHSVTEAIRALKCPETKVDMHPERRMKLAYLAYVEENLPLLKEQNPTLRLSQLKEMLKKQWKMSSEHAQF